MPNYNRHDSLHVFLKSGENKKWRLLKDGEIVRYTDYFLSKTDEKWIMVGNYYTKVLWNSLGYDSGKFIYRTGNIPIKRKKDE